jgi:hypothetical protein
MLCGCILFLFQDIGKYLFDKMQYALRRLPSAPASPNRVTRSPLANTRGERLLCGAMIAFCLAAGNASAAGSFTVTTVDGSARIQRADKKTPDEAAPRSKIQDNDMVETFFQARMAASFGAGSTAILGPNSKGLFNITEHVRKNVTVAEASFTLFGGGLFVKTVPPMHVAVYTSNGVAEMDSGVISAVVDSKSNETGFQVLAGTAQVRNVAQQTPRDLTAGQTTMILPGREPTAPLYLTSRHVTVLRLFFGADNITHELQTSNITPTEDISSDQRLRLSDNILFSKTQRDNAGIGSYKRQFSLDKIYDRIFDDQLRSGGLYHPVTQLGPLFDNAFDLGVTSSFALTQGGVSPLFTVTPTYRAGFVSLGLRATIAANDTKQLGFYSPSGGIRGILDMVDHAEVGYRADSLFLCLGPLADYTIGDGLIVDHYENRNPYSLFQPLGLYGKAGLAFGLTADGFVSDVSDFSVGGLFVSYQPGSFRIGVGYYYDLSQTQPMHLQGDGRFVAIRDTTPATKDPAVHIVQGSLSVDLVSRQDLTAQLSAEVAGRVHNPGHGLVLRLPAFDASFSHVDCRLALVVESGQLISRQLNWFYPTNRYRVIADSSGAVSFLTQDGALSPDRQTGAVEASFSANPHKGADLRLTLKHDVVARYTTPGDSASRRLDYDYDVRVVLNDSLLFFVKYAEFVLGNAHGSTYPATGRYTSSWGFRGGIHVLTTPLLYNIAVQAGFDYYLLDIDSPPNGRVDPGDRIMEASVGLRWGFM